MQGDSPQHQDALPPPSSAQQLLQRLNSLAQQLNHSVTPSLLSQYVTVYVQGAAYSDDAFSSLCEHNFVTTLLTATPKHQVPPMDVLSSFHLLLANTQAIHQLVYLFSQSAFHTLLLCAVEWQGDQEVEYLIQLIKAIVMRMQGGGKSLIKMFVNTRYPHFPLLTAATALAINPRHDPLVRITARQCVLLLASLLDQKDIGRNYLGDIQMAVFYHSLAVELTLPTQPDQEGLTKYMAQLLNTLGHTPTAHSLLCNIIVNCLIVRQMGDPPKLLTFMEVFTHHLRETATAPQQTQHAIKILTIIINRLFFNRFVHSTYLASIKLLPKYDPTLKIPDLTKFIENRAEKIGQKLLNDSEEKVQPAIMENWVIFNRNGEEITRLKQGSGRKSRVSSIFDFITAKATKPNPVDEYLEMLGEMIGLNSEKMRQYPLTRIQHTINYRTGLYWVQESLYHQEQRGMDIKEFNAHCNDLQGKFELTPSFCLEVTSIAETLQKSSNSNNKSTSFPALHFQECFLRELTTFLGSNIGDYLTPQKPQIKIGDMFHLMRLGVKLDLLGRLQKRAKAWLLRKVEELQVVIQRLIIQHDFAPLIQYIINNKAALYFSKPINPPVTSLLQQQIQQNILMYQLLRTYLDPKLPSFHSYVLAKWQQLSSLSTKGAIHSDNNCRTLQIHKSRQIIGYQAKIDDKEAVASFSIKLGDGKVSAQDGYIVQFQGLPGGFCCQSKQASLAICQQLAVMRQSVQQFVTKLVSRYFQDTYGYLRSCLD